MDKGCHNVDYFFDVSNQMECQAKCEAIVACPGIAYSHKIGFTHYCAVCNSNVLLNGGNNFGFYRKPGKSK